MKHLVNGREVELGEPAQGVQVVRLHDRLMVRTPEGAFSALAVRKGETTWVSYRGRVYEVEKAGARRSGTLDPAHGTLVAPMPGSIVDVRAAEGDEVSAGQTLLVLEAMKTQQPMKAPFDGLVERLPVQKGQQVLEGDLLVHVAPLDLGRSG